MEKREGRMGRGPEVGKRGWREINRRGAKSAEKSPANISADERRLAFQK